MLTSSETQTNILRWTWVDSSFYTRTTLWENSLGSEKKLSNIESVKTLFSQSVRGLEDVYPVIKRNVSTVRHFGILFIPK